MPLLLPQLLPLLPLLNDGTPLLLVRGHDGVFVRRLRAYGPITDRDIVINPDPEDDPGIAEPRFVPGLRTPLPHIYPEQPSNLHENSHERYKTRATAYSKPLG